jgi:hypothetical protein
MRCVFLAAFLQVLAVDVAAQDSPLIASGARVRLKYHPTTYWVVGRVIAADIDTLVIKSTGRIFLPGHTMSIPLSSVAHLDISRGRRREFNSPGGWLGGAIGGAIPFALFPDFKAKRESTLWLSAIGWSIGGGRGRTLKGGGRGLLWGSLSGSLVGAIVGGSYGMPAFGAIVWGMTLGMSGCVVGMVVAALKSWSVEQWEGIPIPIGVSFPLLRPCAMGSG